MSRKSRAQADGISTQEPCPIILAFGVARQGSAGIGHYYVKVFEEDFGCCHSRPLVTEVGYCAVFIKEWPVEIQSRTVE